MAAPASNPTTFGASIVSPSKKPGISLHVPAPTMLDSPDLTPVVSRDGAAGDDLPKDVKPHSPFYQHPPASFERVHTRTTSKNHPEAFETDLEKGGLTPLSAHGDENPFTSKVSIDRNQECKMWPSRQTLMQARKAGQKKKRTTQWCGGCAPVQEKWEQLTKRQSLMMKALIAFIIVGVIVAISVGVTKAVNGSVYTSNGNSHPVGDDN